MKNMKSRFLILCICLSACIACTHHDEKYYLNNGNEYFNKGQLDLAIKEYTSALEVNPSSVEAYMSLSAIYQIEKKYYLAIESYNNVIRIDPKRQYAYSNRAGCYYNQGKLDFALLDYNVEIKNYPNNSNAFYNRGSIFFDIGKFELAISDYSSALKINPEEEENHNPETIIRCYNDRGCIYSKRGKYQLAISDFNSAIKINPDWDRAYYNLGKTYRLMGERELSIKNYKMAADLGSEDACKDLKEYYNIEYPVGK